MPPANPVLALMHVTLHVLTLSERVAAGDLAPVAEVEALARLLKSPAGLAAVQCA
jgi:hypothetical protein